MHTTQPITAERQHVREAQRQSLRDRQIKRVVAGTTILVLGIVAAPGVGW